MRILKKKISMIFKLKMLLSAMTNERKNIIFYTKNVKFTKNKTFNNFFCNRTFSYYRYLPILKNDLISIILSFSKKQRKNKSNNY